MLANNDSQVLKWEYAKYITIIVDHTSNFIFILSKLVIYWS